MTQDTNTFYAAKCNGWYVQTDERGAYRCLGPMPTLFRSKGSIQQVREQYVTQSWNSGKPASDWDIVEVEI